MKLAKGVKLQLKLKLKTTRQGTTLESTQAPMAPAEARAYWQEVADHAQRLALQDVTESPQPEPLPPMVVCSEALGEQKPLTWWWPFRPYSLPPPRWPTCCGPGVVLMLWSGVQQLCIWYCRTWRWIA